MSTTTAAIPLSTGLTAGDVRLTRRGRFALVALIAALAFALLSLGQVAVQAGDGSGDAGAPGTAWVVQPGETLWVIAERVDPGTDPRETVARIVAMNDLPSSSVVAGQELVVPA
jgi:hypothetical protein